MTSKYHCVSRQSYVFFSQINLQDVESHSPTSCRCHRVSCGSISTPTTQGKWQWTPTTQGKWQWTPTTQGQWTPTTQGQWTPTTQRQWTPNNARLIYPTITCTKWKQHLCTASKFIIIHWTKLANWNIIWTEKIVLFWFISSRWISIELTSFH